MKTDGKTCIKTNVKQSVNVADNYYYILKTD